MIVPTIGSAPTRPPGISRRARAGGEVVRHLQVLHAEAASGTVRGIGLVSIVVTALATALVSVTGIWAGLSNVLNFLLTMTTYLAPIGLGSAAIRTSALSKGGLTTVAASTARGPAAAITLSALAVMGWQVLALLVGFTVLGWRLGFERGLGGWSPLLLLVLAVLVLGAATLAGAWAGHYWPSTAVAPLGVVFSFAGMYFLSYTAAPVSKLSFIYSGTFYRPELEPNTGLLSAQVMVLAGLILLGGLGLRISSMRRVLTGAVAAALLVVGAVQGQQASASPVRFSLTPVAVPCVQEAGTRLCFWPGYQQSATATLNALLAARTVAAPLLSTPSTYRQDGLTMAGPAATIYLDLPPVDLESVAEAAARAVVPSPCPNDLSDPAADEASSNLSSYIAAQIGGYQPPPEWVAAIAAAPRSQQQVWAAQQVAQITPCEQW